MNKQKGIAPILIVLIIAVLVGGYLIYQKQTKPIAVPQSIVQTSPNPIISPITSSFTDITNWKTYTNTKYGFEIKYPVNAVIDDIPNPTKPLVWIVLPRQSDKDGGTQLSIDIMDNPKSKNIKDFCLSRWDSRYPIIEERQIKIGDIIAYTVRLDTRIGPNVSTTCLAKENKILLLEFNIDSIGNDPFVKEHTQTLNLIISTFKFLP